MIKNYAWIAGHNSDWVLKMTNNYNKVKTENIKTTKHACNIIQPEFIWWACMPKIRLTAALSRIPNCYIIDVV